MSMFDFFNKYSKVVSNDFFKKSLLISLPLFIQAFFVLIINILIPNRFTQVDFGEYKFFLAVFGLISLFSLIGFDNALTRSVVHKKYKSFSDVIKYRFFYSLIGTCILLFLYFFKIGFFYKTSFLILSISIPFIFSLNTALTYLLAKEEYLHYSIVHSISHVFTYLIFIWGLFFLRDINMIIIIFILSSLICSLLVFIYTWNKYKLEIYASQIDEELFNFGMKLSFTQLLPLIVGYLDSILITYFFSLEELALYSIVLLIPTQFVILGKIFSKLFIIEFSKKNPKKSFELIKNKLRIVFIFSFFMVTLGIILIPFFINYFFPEDYSKIIIYSQLLMISYLFYMPMILYNNYIIAYKGSNEDFLSNFYASCLKLFFLILLIPFFGIIGGVIAYIISNIFLYLITRYFSYNIFKKYSSKLS